MSLAQPSLRIHSVLYGNDLDGVSRAVHATARAVAFAKEHGVLGRAEVRFGDCSPAPVLTLDGLDLLRKQNPDLDFIGYEFFDANLGSAAGQNRLMADFDADYLLILNPDAFVAANTILELLAALAVPGVGLAEARQLPFEHPKDYDATTGETSWASTACALVPAEVLRTVGGFDSDTFFLYCDDVDWSWQIRLAGYRIVLRDSARVFHDKRLTNEGRWAVSSAEEFYSAEASLLMAHKWGRPDLVKRYSADLKSHGTPGQRRAVKAFETRRAEGRLPTPVPGADRVSSFVNGAYAVHRY